MKTTPFDTAAHLRDEEDMTGYLHAVLEEQSPALTAAALMNINRARQRLHLTTPFDPADYLKDEAHTTAYLQIAAEEAAENGDNSILLDAIQTAAKARGMADLAKATGIPRESLYRSLREGTSPRYDTVSKILNALGMTITLTPRKTAPN